MSEFDPEALAQLARLLGDESIRVASSQAALHDAVETHFDALVAGLVEETASSDDVIDHDSAREFLDARVEYLRGILSPQQAYRLSQAVQAKIEAW